MKAKLVKTLVFYDEPQLLLLNSTGKRQDVIIAVAIERDDLEFPFFACKVYRRDWTRYLNGKADLRYLFNRASRREYFFFDLATEKDGEITLNKAKSVEEFEKPEYWPAHGFFSSSHTVATDEDDYASKCIQVFNIDGMWETIDFSSFYSKVSDIYGILFAQNELNSPKNDSEKEKLRTSIISRLWRGGGSYSGFYKDLRFALPDMAPLRVNKIQYASPGKIELIGEEFIFSDIMAMLKEFNANYVEAKNAYDDINKILSKEKLKKKGPDASFALDANRDFVKKRSKELLEAIGVSVPKTMFEVCDKNVLVYSKVSLSIYRRFKGLHDFISEGRVEVISSNDTSGLPM
ncbi:hypothetical protein [Emcibacter nanhaiensis]|uniref:DUF4868 domain-containing protein n=1 Tax=Emcibacter nanhaiensis TaxID=1505037 RepID=A0A501PNK4_9PROT|nr:hypothetical protein [Emcibacter nanhaiensis]TPD61993.1 hypothetical protein FIV46_07280 [Emcibacter nanhaiensis]